MNLFQKSDVIKYPEGWAITKWDEDQKRRIKFQYWCKTKQLALLDLEVLNNRKIKSAKNKEQ